MSHAIRMLQAEPFTDVLQVHVTPGDFVCRGQAVVTRADPHGRRELVLADAAVRVESVTVDATDMPLPNQVLLVLELEQDRTHWGALRNGAPGKRSGTNPEIARIMEESRRRASHEVDFEMKAAGEQ